MAIIKNPLTIVQTGGESQVPEYMSAKNFTFDGNACTGYVGDNTLPEIIVPQSYSMSQETISMNGAPIKKDAVIPTLTSFTNVVFCKTYGSNQVTYTSASQLRSNFNIDFPDDDVVLVSLQVSFFAGQLENKLNAILLTPFIASITETREKTYYTNVENFTSALTATSSTAYFSGSATANLFIDGNDYQVTSIKGSDINFLNYRSGFENYTNRIILLNNISTIDTIAFYDCDNLSNIEIPSGVTSIGSDAFYGTPWLTNLQNTSYGIATASDGQTRFVIDVPTDITDDELDMTNVKVIADFAFNNCSNLTSIEIPSSVTSIGDSAFRNCTKLESIAVDPNNVNYCNDEYGVLFNKDKTELIQYPIGNTRTQYTIPSSVTSIGNHAFRDCDALETVTFGANSQLESIGSYAFWSCSKLTSIEIPSSVTSIGDYAFHSCSSLTAMTILATTPPILGNTSAISTATTKIYIPAGTLSAYQRATNWSNFADLFEELPA